MTPSPIASVLRAVPGIGLAALIATASWALAAHYGAPAMLFALLIGMAFHHLAAEPRSAPGIRVASTTVLRLGVALLGLRLSFADIATLGWGPVLAVAALTAGTVGAGVALALLLRRGAAFGVLAGGSVAICGASAALAFAAVLTERRTPERDVIFVVAGVTTLSTAAMVLYPLLFARLDMGAASAGFLIGATIHDVAQVVGAGYSVGEATGDVATYVKLQRVALLPVGLIVVGLALRPSRLHGQNAGITVPWFLWAFVALVLAANLLPIPEPVLTAAATASSWLLITAIAALGVKTSLAEMGKVGPRAAAILVICSLGLLLAALAAERIVFS